MGEGEIQIILRHLEEMRAEQRHDTERLHTRLDDLSRNGCSKAAEHASRSKDQEERLRTAERYMDRQGGTVAAIGVGAPIVVTALIAVGKFLLHRVRQ